ncbi:MAG: dihydropteroate synthase [Spirochaetaceae bacterium]|jgi:dihydropteroate synthase|nr:dihydropteroate synthase [Spirochaetaceae bacterium]
MNTTFNCGNFSLPLGKKTYIMGILNVTADSFSDGGKFISIDDALRHAERMVEDGADIIDIGGESTRPGFIPVGADEETRRVVPVIERLSRSLKAPLSVDTTKPPVAAAALEAGAHIVNDIWGFQKEPELAALSARYGAGVVLMHNSETGVYSDLMGDIAAFLKTSAGIALKAGVLSANICLDPGIGFGKTWQQNLEVMRRLEELRPLGYSILMGTSRKSTIGKVLDLPVNERLEGTAATVALSVAFGADFVRVHDVKEMKRVAAMADAIVRGI